jgi:hypothetical protein
MIPFGWWITCRNIRYAHEDPGSACSVMKRAVPKNPSPTIAILKDNPARMPADQKIPVVQGHTGPETEPGSRSDGKYAGEFCTQCGLPVREGIRFCENCGRIIER